MNIRKAEARDIPATAAQYEELHAARRGGVFIAFEGIDGSGKTTQLALLKARLEAEGFSVLSTKEPTDGPVGRLLRQVLTGEVKMDERVAVPLFAADRLDHLLNPADGLRAALERGLNVLTERYYFSSYAYQTAPCTPMERVIEANAECAALLRPTVTVFFDLDPEEALRRIAVGRGQTELFETRERLTAVRRNYLMAFERLRDVENVLIVDAALPPQALAEELWKRLNHYF